LPHHSNTLAIRRTRLERERPRPLDGPGNGGDGPGLRHVALIPDGNRRWARQRGLPAIEGHRAGGYALDRFIDVCHAGGIKFLTVWPLSPRNLDRPPDEILSLFAVMHRYLLERRDFYRAHRMRFTVIGDLEPLQHQCTALIDLIRSIQAETASYDAMTLTMAFNYNGRDEIVRATRRLIEHGVPAHAIDQAAFARHLDTGDQPDPEIILRTGGDCRLSGFLPYQAQYAELCFTPTLMPDLEAAEVNALLASFAARRYSQ
jgi:undecaprenyl diphosphate synthase